MDPKLDFRNWIRKYEKRYWYLLLFCTLISIGSVIFLLIAPVPLKFLADYVFGSKPAPSLFGLNKLNKKDLLLVVALAYTLIGILSNLYSLFQSLVTRKMLQTVDRSAMNEAFASINTIPHNHPSRKDNGTYIYQITNQSQQLSGYMLNDIVTVIQSVLTIVSVIVIMSLIDLQMTLILAVSIPLLIVSVIYFGRILEKKAHETQIAHTKVYDIISETLSKIKTIQMFAREAFQLKVLNLAITKRNQKANSQLISTNVFSISAESIIFIAVFAALISGGDRVLQGTLTFGDLLLFISYINNLFDPMIAGITSIGSMLQASAALKLVHQSIDESRLMKLNGGVEKTAIKGEIDFQNVYYSVAGRDVFQAVNLHIKPGTTNIFMGPSGSGKSTLLNLLERFAIPDRGFISIDGKPLSQYDTAYLRSHIASLDQEPDLFNMSVQENIAFADPERENNLPDVMGAGKIANISDFIHASSKNYDTVLDNEKLSGGQKQRMALARAVYSRSPIIIMDEPTSALDKASVNTFISNMHYFTGRTILIVTHDYALLDRISGANIFIVDNQSVKPISEYGGVNKYKQRLLN